MAGETPKHTHAAAAKAQEKKRATQIPRQSSLASQLCASTASQSIKPAMVETAKDLSKRIKEAKARRQEVEA
ncbi:hypothetical protein ACJ73_09887 [Blastomyces percursus]|uniref:Uncharacterized protein n=1 Tax=Blastomyces percursus TaxID=1658174 RepID=A0A1J9Q2Q1_9EURO|nr:hypothetical protein ACJ73_09887 [Blastomyces percursus]